MKSLDETRKKEEEVIELWNRGLGPKFGEPLKELIVQSGYWTEEQAKQIDITKLNEEEIVKIIEYLGGWKFALYEQMKSLDEARKKEEETIKKREELVEQLKNIVGVQGSLNNVLRVYYEEILPTYLRALKMEGSGIKTLYNQYKKLKDMLMEVNRLKGATANISMKKLEEEERAFAPPTGTSYLSPESATPASTTEEEELPFRPFQEGGIAYKPTLALIGEREPEAVVPLSKFRSVEIHITNYINGNYDVEELSDKIIESLKKELDVRNIVW